MFQVLSFGSFAVDAKKRFNVPCRPAARGRRRGVFIPSVVFIVLARRTIDRRYEGVCDIIARRSYTDGILGGAVSP